MKTVRIHYFSATGNTDRAVGIFRKHLEETGYSTEIRHITTNEPLKEEGLSDEVIAFPTLGFSAPVMVKKYVKRLPRGKGRKMAVLCVNAGGPAQAIKQMIGLLKKRGYTVSLTASIAYPQNWLQFFPASDQEILRSQTEKGDALALSFARDFTGGVTHLDKPDLGTCLWSRPVSFMFGFVGRRLLGKAFVANSACTSCGLCEKICPAATIHFTGSAKLPVWKSNCQNCNRCINLCPVQAIVTSNLRLGIHVILYVLFIILAAIAGISGDQYLSAMIPWYAALIAGCAIFILSAIISVGLQFTVLDFVLTFIQRHFFPRAFEKGFNSAYRRYRMQGFKPSVTEKQ